MNQTPTTPPEAPITLGSRIRAGRMALGLTQAALAAQVGCSAEMLRKFEADAKRPSMIVVERLAERFGLNGDERERMIALVRGARPTAAAPPFLFPRTKLQPPRPRGDLLPRPRLIAPLRAALQHARLMLITAPAGAGKTTLIVGALSELRRTNAWIALDADDNDPARFLAVLLAALDQLAPGTAALVEMPPLAGPHQPDRTSQVRQAVAALINAFLEAAPVPGLLVLDDLHVIEEPAIYAALEYLIDHLPTALTLVVATRHDPPLPLPRLRARRELLELRLPDLRFTADETADLLTGCLGLTLSAGEISALHRRTEGWAAGLSLLAASLAPLHSSEERSRFLIHLVKTDRYLFDYLAEEVLNRQDAPTRSFLLETAILPELTPLVCQVVTGRDDAAAVLDNLYRRNLFLIAIDIAQDRGPRTEDRGVNAQATYRYHDLFRVFLLERLRRDSPELRRELHRRAATCAGDPLRAVEHLLQAELWDAAASSIEAMGERLLSNGAHHTAQMLITMLPETQIAARPRLRYILGLCAWQRWEPAAAATLLAGAATDFARAGDAINQGAALVFLATALNRAGDLQRARATAEQALLLPLAPPRRVQLLADRAWQNMISGAWTQSVADLDEALAIVERAGNGQVLAAFEVAMAGSLMGLPGGIARIARLSRLVDAHALPEQRTLRAAAMTMCAWSAIWRDHWNEADAVSQRVLELLPSTEVFTAIHVEIYIQQSVYATLEGKQALTDEQFIQMLTALEQQAGLRRALNISLLHALARVRWLQGRHDDLRAIHERMTAAFQDRIWPTDATLCREIGALVHLAEGRIDAAITDLRAVADDQARLAIVQILGDPRLHLAHAYLQANRPDQARAAAGPALAAIRREGVPGRLRWQGMAIVIPILRLCAANGPQADFAAEMLVALDGVKRK